MYVLNYNTIKRQPHRQEETISSAQSSHISLSRHWIGALLLSCSHSLKLWPSTLMKVLVYPVQASMIPDNTSDIMFPKELGFTDEGNTQEEASLLYSPYLRVCSSPILAV